MALSRLQSAYLLGVVGVLLLLNPLYVPALPIDDPSHTYEAIEVAPSDDPDKLLEGTRDVDYLDEDVICYGFQRRACQFERNLLAGNEVEVRYIRDDGVPHGARYAYLDGHFYERTVTERNETVYLELERLSAEELLANASSPLKQTSNPGLVRQIIERDEVTTHEQLEVSRSDVGIAETLVEVDGSYYALREVSDTHPDYWLEPLLMAVGLVAGLGLTLIGQHRWLTAV